MATKIFCDICESEIHAGSGRKIDLPVHIPEIAESDDPNDFHAGYYDRRAGAAVSGRSDSIDMCAKCTNHVMIKAYNEMKRIHDEKGIVGSFAPFGANGARGLERTRRDRDSSAERDGGS